MRVRNKTRSLFFSLYEKNTCYNRKEMISVLNLVTFPIKATFALAELVVGGIILTAVCGICFINK